MVPAVLRSDECLSATAKACPYQPHVNSDLLIGFLYIVNCCWAEIRIEATLGAVRTGASIGYDDVGLLLNAA